MSDTTNMAVLSYKGGNGEATFNVANLSDKTRYILMDEGLTHFLGNRVASKVIGKARTAIAETLPQVSRTLKDGSTKMADATAKDVSDSDLSAWKAVNGATMTAWRNEIFAATVKAITDGTLDVQAERASAKPFDPVADRMESICRMAVVRELQHRVNPKTGAPFLPADPKAFTKAQKDYVSANVTHILASEAGADKYRKQAVKALEREAREADSALEGAGLLPLPDAA